MNNTIGQKIKNFRKRSGKSQFELELDIDASPGSISRIESGEVNPTKETLVKIIEALDLNGFEATSLFNVEPNIASFLKIPNELLNSKSLEEILSKTVNSIVKELNLLAGFVTIKRDNKLYAQTTTDRWFNKMVFNLIGVPYNQLNVDLDKDTDNLCVRAFVDKNFYLTKDLSEVGVPAITSSIAKLISKITGFKSGIVIPILHNGSSLGTFFIGKNFEDNFEREIPVLQEFTKYIGEAIYKHTKEQHE